MKMTSGELASAAGVNVQTVRYYERRGLLTQPARTPSVYRQYGSDALVRLRFIRRAQELGFSLAAIEELLALRLEEPSSCAEVEVQARSKLADVRSKIEELKRMEGVLERLAASCAAREETAECPILEGLLQPG